MALFINAGQIRNERRKKEKAIKKKARIIKRTNKIMEKTDICTCKQMEVFVPIVRMCSVSIKPSLPRQPNEQ